MMQNMFKNMDSLYTEISEFFSFDKQKYTIEEFFGDIKTFKDDFTVSLYDDKDCVFKYEINGLRDGTGNGNVNEKEKEKENGNGNGNGRRSRKRKMIW